MSTKLSEGVADMRALLDNARLYVDAVGSRGSTSSFSHGVVAGMVASLLALIDQLREEHVSNCLSHRCRKHYGVRQLNATEGQGAECGACITADLASLRAVLGQARDALDDLVSWFPEKARMPEIHVCIKTGEYGVDDAVQSARDALAALDERDGECARLREFAADFAALEQTNADILRERDAARVEVAKLTLATTNLRGIVSDQEEDLASLRDNLAASQAREARLVSALEAIRDRKPNVCAGFELCDHIGCQASYEAWADADTALSAPASDALGAIRRAQDALLHATNFSERLDALGALDRIFGEVSSS